MKTKVPRWMAVFLAVVSGTFICGSAQAGWQRDMVLGTGGNSGGYSPQPYYNPGPTAEQIAAQQAAQQAAQEAAQREAEHQARLKTAHSENDAGLASFNRKDWAAAAAAFQRALNNWPDNPTLRSNLAKAQEQLAAQRREEERKVADTAAASNMKDAINDASNSLSQDQQPQSLQPPQSQQQQPMGGGLAFVPADDDSDNAVTTGAFNSKQSKPHLTDRDPDAPKTGSSTKAIDQLTSLAHNEKSLKGGKAEAQSYGSQAGLDTFQKQGGSLNDVKVENPAASVMLPKLMPEDTANPLIKEDVDNFNKWNPQLQQAREDVKKAQAAVDSGKDPGALATLKAAQTKSDGLQIAVESAVADIADQKEKKIRLQSFAINGGPAPGAQGQPVASGSSAPAQESAPAQGSAPVQATGK